MYLKVKVYLKLGNSTAFSLGLKENWEKALNREP